ncbi:cytochrome P450 [Coniochaeta sp. 2T2.1]|nr:cytochrome P450 [Coniochaeta sp. 2T2.1]
MALALPDSFAGLPASWFIVAGAVALVAFFVRNKYHGGLNRYPGPVLASFTNWWRFFCVMRRKSNFEIRELHEKHGDVVRLGPDCLSFSSPEAMKAIYGLNNRLSKSEFYPVQMQISRGKILQSLFGTTDNDYHARLRRTVSNAFSMSTMVQYEPRVDETARVFLSQTSRLFAQLGAKCEFVKWLQYFAFDVITEVTYSRRVGFIDNFEDVDGIIAWLNKLFDYTTPVGQMPFLDKLLVKNPISTLLSKYGLIDNSSGTARFSRARMAERLGEIAQKQNIDEEDYIGSRGDLLTSFLKSQRNDPVFFDDGRVLTMAASVALAGSDTTAISLAAVFYHLAKNPAKNDRLRREVDDAVSSGRLQDKDGIMSWTDAQKLPYLDACIKEVFRIHPAIGFILERVVPPQGMDIDGHFIPGGTVVGCSPWTIHRRREVYGDDVDDYRPERWLVDETAPADEEHERIRVMTNTLFHFGGGSRTCLGKNIALLELYKLIPSFIRRFEVKLANPDEEWELHAAWFIKPQRFDVYITEREK